MELETKAVDHGHEIKQAFAEFLAGFEAFKQANDERLNGLERRSADVLNEEKVARIDQALTETKQKLDALMLAQSRPSLGPVSGDGRKSFDPAQAERKARFDRYVRKGEGLDLEVKSLSEGSNPDGGYTVPLEIERTIDRVLAKASPIRSIAGVRQIGAATRRARKRAMPRMSRRAHAAGDRAIQNQIQTVMQKVPVYVDDKSDAGCVLPWGAVRLLDAAAGGAGLDDVAARIAPGQPDGAPSDVKLSEAVALLARDLGIARQNAGQLEHLEKAVDAPLHK
jgi:hypothetical protein